MLLRTIFPQTHITLGGQIYFGLAIKFYSPAISRDYFQKFSIASKGLTKQKRPKCLFKCSKNTCPFFVAGS